MRFVRTALTSLSTVFMLACVAAWLATSLPMAGWRALVIPTGSMRPSLPPGSLAIVRSVPLSSLHIGDVITYADPLSPARTITHRIVGTYTIGKKVPGFITKGDANQSTDLPIPGGSIQGKMIWSVPYVGTAFGWMKTWLGIAVLVYAPALLIIIGEIKRLSEYYRRAAPYRLSKYRPQRMAFHLDRRMMAIPAAAFTAFVIAMLMWQPLAMAHVLLSGSVKLRPNIITAKHGTTCGIANQHLDQSAQIANDTSMTQGDC